MQVDVSRRYLNVAMTYSLGKVLAVRPARIWFIISSVVRGSSLHPPKKRSISEATRSRRSDSVSPTLSRKRRKRSSRSLADKRWAWLQMLSTDIPIVLIMFAIPLQRYKLFFNYSLFFSLKVINKCISAARAHLSVFTVAIHHFTSSYSHSA